MRAVLLSLVLLCASCGRKEAAALCADGCPDAAACDDATGLCVERPEVKLGQAGLSPRFDAGWDGGRLHVAVYDRLWGRFLYGTEPAAGAELNFESVATVASPDPMFRPGVVLLPGEDPALLLEGGPGEVSYFRRVEGRWQGEAVLAGVEGLSYLDATMGGGRVRMCVGDRDGRLGLAEWQPGGAVSAVTWVSPFSAGVSPVVPCAVAWLDGRTSVLSAARPAGLVAVAGGEQGIETAEVDGQARPVAVSVEVTAGGLAVAYVDALSGELRFATSASGAIVVETVEAGVVSPGALPPQDLTVASLRAGDGALYLAFVDFSDGTMRLAQRAGSGGWSTLFVRPSTLPFLPAVLLDAGGAPVLPGVEMDRSVFPPLGRLLVVRPSR